VKAAHFWIRDRLWTGYLAVGGTVEAANAVFVASEGSEQWNAWSAYHRICGEIGIPGFRVSGVEGQRTARLPTEWPPVGRGIDPRATWEFFAVRGTPQSAAWLRRLRETDPPPAIRMPTEMVNGQALQGMRVPSEWPPNKSDDDAEIKGAA
jgi:hypothetical protein